VNSWQLLRQLKATLEAAAWSDSPSELVFGQVALSAGFASDSRPSVQFPLCRVRPLGEAPDEEEPGLVQLQVEVELTQRVYGDRTGEVALVGGSRSSGQGGSDGRGLLEIEEELKSTLGALARVEGIGLRFDHATSAAAGEVDGFGYLVFRVYTFSAWLTESRTYPAARKLAGTDAGSQTADLTWENPASRFDRSDLVLRVASGSTAPSSVTDGTGVTVGAAAESLSHAPGGAGTWSYALFVGYDETGSGSPDRYSTSSTATVVLA